MYFSNYSYRFSFSFDSILTAVGMTNGVPGALYIWLLQLSLFDYDAICSSSGNFVNTPSIQILGLSF
jgi:hypothetical protein